jgi:hypothetical protein
MTQTLFVIAGLLVCPSISGALVAQVGADAYSFGFESASTSSGDTLYFTTHDGLSGPPLLECGAVCVSSDEASPNSPGSTEYYTDYLVADSIGVYEYGTAILNIASSDSDLDGMLDALELSSDGGFSLGGLTYPDWNAFGIYFNSTVTGSTLRAPDLREGTYSGALSNPIQTASFGGTYALSGAYGTVEYSLTGSPTLDWTLTRRAIDGTLRTFTGTSPVSFIGTDTLVLPSFDVFDDQSSAFLETVAGTLARSGDTFRGTLELIDGELSTSWRDYAFFNLEIIDRNDLNADGLPDILDVPEPDFVAQIALYVLALAVAARRRSSARSNPFRAGPGIKHQSFHRSLPGVQIGKMSI